MCIRDSMKTAYEENGGGIKGVVAAGWEGIKGYYSAGFTFVDNLSGGKLSEIKMCIRDRSLTMREYSQEWGVCGTSTPVSYTHLDVYKRQNDRRVNRWQQDSA